MTSLGDDVFVARFSSQQVEVYSAATLAFRLCLTVPGLSWPGGLAACSKNKCLYASDGDNECVNRVDLGGNNAARKWSVTYSPMGLSVNSEHNLIVACSLTDKLQEYTTDGSLVREIVIRKLPADVTRPWHAIQLSSGNYVVSHDTSPGVVSVVGADGKVIRSYGQSQSSDVVQMKYPASLAVTKSNNVLVADVWNNRVLSINSLMRSVQDLALSVDGGIQGPRGLCLDESRGRLYVGYWSGDLQVFAFVEVCV